MMAQDRLLSTNLAQVYCMLTLGLLLALALLQRFFSGFSGFSPPEKKNPPNYNLIRIEDLYENLLKLM